MLIILLFFDEYLKILFELLIYSLYLNIWLRMPGCGWDNLDTEQIVEFLCEKHYELQSSVQNYMSGKAMKFPNIVQEESHSISYSNW